MQINPIESPATGTEERRIECAVPAGILARHPTRPSQAERALDLGGCSEGLAKRLRFAAA